MLCKTKAIVLHQVKYGESSIIVTFYTEMHGRLSCMVNGVRSKKSRFPAMLFQPLTLLEIDFYSRPSRNIQRLKDAVTGFHYHSVPFSPAKSAVALFLAEVLFLTLREEESNPVLFSYLFHALQWYDTTEQGISVFHPWFMLQLTRYLGFFPSEQQLPGYGINPGDNDAFGNLNREASEALIRIVQSAQSPPALSGLSHKVRNEVLQSIVKYYSLHIDGFSGLRSLSVLQEVFSPRTG